MGLSGATQAASDHREDRDMIPRPSSGFTIVELLILIAIVGILAAALIPNLLQARARSFDTATVSCLKQLATQQEAAKTDHPFIYDPGVDPANFIACEGLVFTEADVQDAAFAYTGYHPSGRSIYTVGTGTSVVVTLIGGVP